MLVDPETAPSGATLISQLHKLGHRLGYREGAREGHRDTRYDPSKSGGCDRNDRGSDMNIAEGVIVDLQFYVDTASGWACLSGCR